MSMDTQSAMGAADAMASATLDELRMLVYHPRHASDPERPLRFARALLGSQKLSHAALASLPETDAQRLIAALKKEFPDRRAAIVARVTQELLDRP